MLVVILFPELLTGFEPLVRAQNQIGLAGRKKGLGRPVLDRTSHPFRLVLGRIQFGELGEPNLLVPRVPLYDVGIPKTVHVAADVEEPESSEAGASDGHM